MCQVCDVPHMFLIWHVRVQSHAFPIQVFQSDIYFYEPKKGLGSPVFAVEHLLAEILG